MTCRSTNYDRDDEAMSTATDLDCGAPFCTNPRCALHVSIYDARVRGRGNWIRLPDGRLFGRARYGEAMLCDHCGRGGAPLLF